MDNTYFLMNCNDCKFPTVFYCDGPLVTDSTKPIVDVPARFLKKDLATCLACLNTHSYEHKDILSEQLKGCSNDAKLFVEGHLERLLGDYATLPEVQRPALTKQIKSLSYMYKNITGDWYRK